MFINEKEETAFNYKAKIGGESSYDEIKPLDDLVVEFIETKTILFKEQDISISYGNKSETKNSQENENIKYHIN